MIKLITAIRSVLPAIKTNLKPMIDEIKNKTPKKKVDKVDANEKFDRRKSDKKKRQSRIMHKFFPFNLFYDEDRHFKVSYFYIAVFCFISAAMMIVKTITAIDAVQTSNYNEFNIISSTDIVTVTSLISAMLLLFNRKKNE